MNDTTDTTDDNPDFDELLAELLAWSNEPARPPPTLNTDVNALAELLRTALSQPTQHNATGFHGVDGWTRPVAQAAVYARTFHVTTTVRVEPEGRGWIAVVNGNMVCHTNGQPALFATLQDAQWAVDRAMARVKLIVDIAAPA